MTSSSVLALDDKKVECISKNNGFQEKYRADNVKSMKEGNRKACREGPILRMPMRCCLIHLVIGTEVYKSTDAGRLGKHMVSLEGSIIVGITLEKFMIQTMLMEFIFMAYLS
jgi:hypothetical protein